MDIEEIKKYSKNKIEADDLTKQVRRRIKETAWEKQNRREGFSETFQPLISQFKKPEDSKENIFTQNQKMLQNQLALTSGLKDNQKAITEGFKQFERLADRKELPGVEAIEEDKDPIAKFNVKDFDKYLSNKEGSDLLKNSSYEHLPSYYFDKNVSEISSLINDVNTDLEIIGKEIHNTANFDYSNGYFLAKPKSQNPHPKTINNIKNYNILSVYLTNLNLLLMYKNKTGSGMFYFSSPEELIKRFELLGGSLAAGNNGVLPEYIQIAHRLRDLGIFTNNQRNKLLRNYINIR